MSWPHYRLLMRIDDERARLFYAEEAVKSDWSVRQLQMQMYLNYYTRKMMNEGDNHPIGILLCADKSDTLVRFTLPEDYTQIYAAKYMPTAEELRRELNLDEFEKLEEENDGET